MGKVARALVIGGGIGGNAAALGLARAGTQVDLVESDPAWRVYGAGLTMTGPTLRAFERLGMLDAIREHGFLSRGLRLFDPAGRPMGEIPIADTGVVGMTGGIMRPVLHRLLCDRVRAAGIDVRLGATVTALDAAAARPRATFDDGTSAEYDLVIGADGCFSSTRAMLFPDADAPRYTGQACWRLVAPRPPQMTHAEFYLGRIKAGLVPCSRDELYMFVLENVPTKVRKREGDDLVGELRALIAEFGGSIATVRDGMGPASNILYRPLEVILLPLPWHRGRVLLIGDAVHATTPHLASGAGIAVEDAVVLVEELARAADIDEAIARFEARRFERCRLVVTNSVALGQMEIDGADPAAHGALMAKSSALLSADI